MNEFIFDGLSSSTFGTYVASSNFLDGASRDIQSVEIPGRSGNVILDNGRYNNFPLVVNVYIRKDITQNAQYLKAFLLSHSTKYFVYEESFAPDVYRMARFTGEFTVETFDHQGGAFTIEFDCMPQRFLKSGTVAQEITGGSGTIMNPTAFESSPLLTVYGSGAIGINDEVITIKNDALGYIKLADAFTLSGEEIKTITTTDLFNSGDYITVDEGSVYFRVNCGGLASSASVYFSGTLAPDTYDVNTAGTYLYLKFTVPKNVKAVPPSNFTLNSVSFTVVLDTGSGINRITGSVQQYFYPSEVIVQTAISNQAGMTVRNFSAAMNGISGVSSVGGSYPFMLDLESLKAYKEIGGQVVNLNHLVEYGIDPPTLKPGTNEITSDTYPSTQVDIVPRWWTL